MSNEQLDNIIKQAGEALVQELPKGFYGRVEYIIEAGRLVVSKVTKSIK